MSKYLYHGSTYKINKYLKPYKSKLVGNQKVVYATNKYYFALLFAANNADDRDFEIGHINNMPYVLEQYPNAFDKFLIKKSGYIYYLSPKDFKTDPRVGMKNSEFISTKRVKILKRKKINNLMSELKKTKITIITFDMKISALRKYIR